jgi:hypothetical protein
MKSAVQQMNDVSDPVVLFTGGKIVLRFSPTHLPVLARATEALRLPCVATVETAF